VKDRKYRVLVVDDDPLMQSVLEMKLTAWGYLVVVASDAYEAFELLHRENLALVLSDVVMPELSGLELLRELKRTDVDRPVILMTAHGTVGMAVEAMQEGAENFLTKPLDYAELRRSMDRAIESRQVLRHSRRPNRTVGRRQGMGGFQGASPEMQRVYEMIESLALSDSPVLITGESGTGKELAARMIHERSLRSKGPFIAKNSAAIPRELVESEMFGHVRGAFTGAGQDRKGCFELADRGTLFLDEIAEMPMELQPKLLRILDEARFQPVGGNREMVVDVRILSATNIPPRSAVRDKLLREDLYYRLNVVTLHLPPLRQREGDIALLAHYFLDHFGQKFGASVREIHPETLAILEAYKWPGNVRELKNVIERATILSSSDRIMPSDIPAYVRHPDQESFDFEGLPQGMTIAEAERLLVIQTLRETGNNRSETARRLGVTERTIRNKIRTYGLTL